MPLFSMDRRLALITLAGALATPATALALPDDASAQVRKLVRWSAATADHQGLLFAVIDGPGPMVGQRARAAGGRCG